MNSCRNNQKSSRKPLALNTSKIFASYFIFFFNSKGKFLFMLITRILIAFCPFSFCQKYESNWMIRSKKYGNFISKPFTNTKILFTPTKSLHILSCLFPVIFICFIHSKKSTHIIFTF